MADERRSGEVVLDREPERVLVVVSVEQEADLGLRELADERRGFGVGSLIKPAIDVVLIDARPSQVRGTRSAATKMSRGRMLG